MSTPIHHRVLERQLQDHTFVTKLEQWKRSGDVIKSCKERVEACRSALAQALTQLEIAVRTEATLLDELKQMGVSIANVEANSTQ
jgi:hypothetical protein